MGETIQYHISSHLLLQYICACLFSLSVAQRGFLLFHRAGPDVLPALCHRSPGVLLACWLCSARNPLCPVLKHYCLPQSWNKPWPSWGTQEPILIMAADRIYFFFLVFMVVFRVSLCSVTEFNKQMEHKACVYVSSLRSNLHLLLHGCCALLQGFQLEIKGCKLFGVTVGPPPPPQLTQLKSPFL